MITVALIDYNAGNIHSVEKALKFVGAHVYRAYYGDQLKEADAIVLPGVGAFDDCMESLEQQGLINILKELLLRGIPYLGICLGYQVLFEKSEEFGSKRSGLSLFKGNVKRFPQLPGLKIPQIGWNQIEIVNTKCPLFENIASGSYVYFVHSYYPVPEDSSIIATRTFYGNWFASAIWHNNIFAVQFHPEKSQKVGLQLLRNFIEFASSIRLPRPNSE